MRHDQWRRSSWCDDIDALGFDEGDDDEDVTRQKGVFMAEKMKIVAALRCGSGKNSRLSVDGEDGGTIAERQESGFMIVVQAEDSWWPAALRRRTATDLARKIVAVQDCRGVAAEVKVDGGDSRRHGVGSTRMTLRLVAERRGGAVSRRRLTVERRLGFLWRILCSCVRSEVACSDWFTIE
ncbi:hypothetical protein LR48_Vigan10g130500 [Vigna angularis]|uniref:Uncharacterized protein n=1 Tax=Phaseolus angularis TaxID=3914 RepID=A0A0L9VK93_PHAAN|nr:hypothetical protein LR48_Vigan10g130500 [Vigna angularis]